MTEHPSDRIIRKKPEDDRFKIILDKLRELGFIEPNFSGELSFSFYQGGISTCNRLEKLK